MSASSDVVRESLARFIRVETAAVDYFAAYAGEVVAQHADGTVDVQCGDPRLPGFQRIRVRWGAPGVVAQLAAKAQVMVAFENGDPGKPVVVGFAFDGAQLVRLGGTAGDGADATEAALRGSTYRQNEKQLHADLASAITSAGAALTALATALNAYGVPAKAALPVMGADLAALGAVLQPAGVALAQAASTLTAYEAAASSRGDDLSTRVKLK